MKLAKDQIARQFTRAASTYDQAAQLQNEMAVRLIGLVPTDITGRLVDLGCGTGWALELFAATERFELTAIDLAPGMIEYAQSRIGNVEFHCCDLEHTPLPDDSADVVFSNAAIQWCQLKSASKEMHRIAKPGARIVVSTFGQTTLHEVRSAWLETGDDANRIHSFESTDDIRSELAGSGFDSVSVLSENRLLVFASVDELLQSIKQMGATYAATDRHQGLLGVGRYQRFRQVLENRLSRDGRLELTFECIYATAKKR